MSPIGRRFAVLALLAVAGALLLVPAGTRAGVVGSPHDFSDTGPYATDSTKSGLAPSGACSGCHISHRSNESFLWPRYLTNLKRPTHLTMDNDATYNFVLPATIQCYDCHDGDKITGKTHDFPYVEPVLGDFDTSHRPQNILFGFKKNGLGDMTVYGSGPQPGKLVPGYYETNPPGPSANDGVNTSAPPDQAGGHYFKQDPIPPSINAIDNGDKLPCSDCHDPHAWDGFGRNQAFFRQNFPGSILRSRLGTDVRASETMANPVYPTSSSRNNDQSRLLCAACHGYSDLTGGGDPITPAISFKEINAAYQDVRITGMTSPVAVTIGQHKSASQAACVTCHPHNSVGASCAQCHGFPPAPYPPNRATTPPAVYTQRDPHPQHLGRQDGQPANSFSVYKYECTVCHATSAMGSRGADNVHATGQYNIAYDFSSLGVANPPDVPPFTTNGLTCANVYCHSNGGSDNTMNGTGNYYRTVQWGVTTQGLRCNSCHGPSTDNNAIQTGMPNYTSGAAGSATANSHAIHVVNNSYECFVCHAATAQGTYDAGRTIKGSPLVHVNGKREVVFDGTKAKGDYDNAQKSCSVSCHGAGAPQWGGTLLGGCFSCHSGTEQIYKPQLDNNVPNPVDNNEYLSSGHGRTSGNYPGDNNAPAGFGNYTTAPTDCYYCHSRNAGHTTKDANDPFRLGYGADTTGQKGYVQGAFADNTDDLCLRCHGVPDGLNPQRAKGTAAQNMQIHAEGITGMTRSPWTHTPWKCVDCHDPHGDGKPGAERWMMVRSGINAPTSTSDGSNAGSDGKSITKRVTDVSAIAFYNQDGFAAGSYAHPENGTGGVRGPCEVCHNKTNTYSRTTDNAGTHASRTGRCTTCHPHGAGFGPKACKGCHGGDNGDTGQVSNNAPNITKYWRTSGHGMKSPGAPKTIDIECEACHDMSSPAGAGHKTDGSAGLTDPPTNTNTQMWPYKSAADNNISPNANTSHLKSAFFPSGTPLKKYEYALAFDKKCGDPVSAGGCHGDYAHERKNHPKVPPNSTDPMDLVLTFDPAGKGSVANPKLYYWYAGITSASDYRDRFYESRSPWVVNDVTTSASSGSFSDNNTHYGTCVSCHDPHGTNAPINVPGATTNLMLRGNSHGSQQFCNTVCHGSPTLPPPP